MPQVSDYTALLSGYSVNGTEGRSTFLTYSFATTPPEYLGDRYTDGFYATFRAFSAAYQQVARNALNAYASVSGLTLFEVPGDQGDIVLMEYDLTGAAGFAYYPGDGFEGDRIVSDVFIDKQSTSNDTNSYLLLHEIGHALGLKHAFEGDLTLAPAVDNAAYSVLSSQYARGFAGNLGIFDVQAVQFLYGAADQDGRHVASWSWDPTNFILTQGGGDGDDTILGLGLRDVIAGGAGNDKLLGRAGDDTLSGEGGNDELQGGPGADRLFGGDGQDRLLGNSGGGQADGSDWMEGGAAADYLKGEAGDDALFGGDGDDQLLGDTGDDRLDGGVGRDSLVGGAGSDLLIGGASDDAILGNDQNDRLFGGDGIDSLYGNSGDDILSGGAGRDTLYGDVGSDTAVFEGLTSDYNVSRYPGGRYVSGRLDGERDTLVDVESIAFRDATLTFDPDSAAAQIMRLYDTVLDRLPDAYGLDAWTDALAAGRPLIEVARGFLGSAEFQAATGALSNADFVEYLYVHALGRPSDAAGKAGWVAALDGGTERASLLLSFSESLEQRGLTAATLAAGLYLTDDTYQEVAALYDSFAGRLPDAGGLVYWAELIKSGTASLMQVAEGFAGSEEFRLRTAGLGNDAFVDYLYRNTLDRGADPAGAAGWVAALNGGASRGQVLLGFSSSDEHLILIQNQINGGIDLLV